jgi:hypothetical protein
MDDLRSVIAEMRLYEGAYPPKVKVWADRLESAQSLQAAPEGGEVCIVCDWKDADPFPRFIEAEVGGRSVAFEWRYRNDGLKELVITTQGETK